jgi:hypothetical protein
MQDVIEMFIPLRVFTLGLVIGLSSGILIASLVANKNYNSLLKFLENNLKDE